MSDLSVNDEANPEQVAETLPVPAPPPSPGEHLAYARETHGWSIEQVANQLNLAPRQIAALEADNYAALPGAVIVRGFIRSYAKLLRIDSAPLLAMLAAEHAVTPSLAVAHGSLSASFPDKRVRSAGQSGSPLKSVAWFVIGLVFLLLLALGGQKMGWIPPLPASVSGLLGDKLSSLQPQPGQQQAEPPEPQNPAETIVETVPSDIVPGEPEAAAAPVAPATPAAAAPATVVATGHQLVLQLRQDSWIEVKRADGSTQFSRIAKAGTSETIDITDPVTLTVGNAAGVDATWRGAPLTLTGTSNNVARLSLK